MKRYRILLILILVTGLTQLGCKKDWFDIKSDPNLTVPSTLQDFEYLLDNYNVLSLMATPGSSEIASDGHFIPENTWLGSSLTNEERNAYTWSYIKPNLLIRDWKESYKRIFQFNMVLDGLKKTEPKNTSEQEQFNRVKGNALFHRAKAYYDLAQIYAQPYRSATASTDMGIPLKEGVDVTEEAFRSSVAQTYEQIIADLKQAAHLLPPMPQLLSRGSRAASFALLSRTYLAMNEYTSASIYSDSCLNIYNTLLDYNTIPLTITSLGAFNKEVLFFSGMLNQISLLSGRSFIDPALYVLYDVDDRRKQIFFGQNAGGNIIFKGMYHDAIIPFSGIATDEVYLIRAECFARDGNKDAALKYLNDLLIKRWETGKFVPVTASSAEEALRKVLTERKKELLFRGLRWTDLRRLNLDDRFKETLTRTAGGVTYTLEPNSYQYTFRIPDDVMMLAPKMQQTPGWPQ